ncbi:MAG: hypothetical protein ACYDEQ_00990 [Desulfocucumaceae bacterium]
MTLTLAGLNSIALIALFFVSGLIAVRMSLKSFLSIITDAGFLKLNYKGNEIPCGAGVVFWFSHIAVITLLFLFLPVSHRIESIIFLLTITTFCMLGLMDDFWGNGACKGIAGHLKSLVRGRPTTGSIKAIVGMLAALYISAAIEYRSGNWHIIPLDALVLALSVNLINLLDLRPGRAGKFFLAAASLIIIAFWYRPETLFMALSAGSLLAFISHDLKAKCMMGDAGSNVLGSVLGLSAIWLFDIYMRLLYLGFLLMVHIIAEKYSFSSIIAGNRAFDYIDRLGRK